MRHINLFALLVSGTALTMTAAPAFAGSCGYGSNPAACDAGVSVSHVGQSDFGPMTVNIEQPMGHLSSINYTRSPNVTITRIHGMGPTADLSDAPSGFTGGCHPTSTTYCRSDAGTPINVQMNGPRPVTPVVRAPVYQQPAYSAPSAPRVVAVGGGYDPSKFIPRVYGDNTITPGIVHAPTSYIDRSPANAAAALQGAGLRPVSGMSQGSTFVAPQVPHSQMPAPQMRPTPMQGVHMQGGHMQPQMNGRVIGQVSSFETIAAAPAPHNAYTGVDGSGGYWEKVSGVTRFGDTIATQVICRRQAPQPTVQRRVHNVIGVPVPVQTPVPYAVDVQQNCAPVGENLGRYGHSPQGQSVQGHSFQGQSFQGHGGYGKAPLPAPHQGQAPSGRWTY